MDSAWQGADSSHPLFPLAAAAWPGAGRPQSGSVGREADARADALYAKSLAVAPHPVAGSTAAPPDERRSAAGPGEATHGPDDERRPTPAAVGGLRGLAARAAAGPGAVVTRPAASPASVEASAGEAARAEGLDDVELLQQLVRICRREAERDGIDLESVRELRP